MSCSVAMRRIHLSDLMLITRNAQSELKLFLLPQNSQETKKFDGLQHYRDDIDTNYNFVR